MASEMTGIGSSTFEALGATGERRVRRVLVVDRHPIVRHGLRRVLEQQDDLTVCGESATEADLDHAIRQLKPDVVVADIDVRHGDGLDAVRSLRIRHPLLAILILSSQDEAIYAERLLAAGANGYIMKYASEEQFLRSLRRVLDGKTYVSDAVSTNMIRKYSGGAARLAADPIGRLSGRELQILNMIGRGMSTREMATSLHLSIKTIESHRQRIKRKLNLETGPQLVRYALLLSSASTH